MAKKVRIVDTLKEKRRNTSLGVVEFDKKGVSINEYSREDVLPIIEASLQLSILGEKKIIKVKKEEVSDKEETKEKPSGFSKEQVDAKVKKNSERLLDLISKTLGLEQSLIEAKMATGEVSEPMTLIPVVPVNEAETTQDLRSDQEIEIETAKEKLASMKIEELRNTLVEAKIDEELWKDLKGKEGRTKMEELILNKVKEEQK